MVVAKRGSYAARPSGTKDIHKIYAANFQGSDHPHYILNEVQAPVNAAPIQPSNQASSMAIDTEKFRVPEAAEVEAATVPSSTQSCT